MPNTNNQDKLSLTLNKDIDDYLISIVMGVQYRPNFSIEDQLGKIADLILYTKDAFFNPKIFPLVTSATGRRKFHSETSKDSLIIDNSNIILEIIFGDSFQLSQKPDIIKYFNKEIINGIMKIFLIHDITRIGYVNRYVFKEEQLASKFVERTIGNTLQGINDINLSFSKKLPLQESIVKKDISDYDNVIFNVVKKSALEEIFMAIDYQRYFDPYLQSTSELKIDDFFINAGKYNQKSFPTWIKNYYLEA
jgi:hypothetical protein